MREQIFSYAATIALFAIAGGFTLFREWLQLKAFRKNIQPAEYAIVKTENGKQRCKLIAKDKDGFYYFLIVDSVKPVIAQQNEIFMP